MDEFRHDTAVTANEDRAAVHLRFEPSGSASEIEGVWLEARGPSQQTLFVRLGSTVDESVFEVSLALELGDWRFEARAYRNMPDAFDSAERFEDLAGDLVGLGIAHAHITGNRFRVRLYMVSTDDGQIWNAGDQPIVLAVAGTEAIDAGGTATLDATLYYGGSHALMAPRWSSDCGGSFASLSPWQALGSGLHVASAEWRHNADGPAGECLIRAGGEHEWSTVVHWNGIHVTVHPVGELDTGFVAHPEIVRLDIEDWLGTRLCSLQADDPDSACETSLQTGGEHYFYLEVIEHVDGSGDDLARSTDWAPRCLDASGAPLSTVVLEAEPDGAIIHFADGTAVCELEITTQMTGANLEPGSAIDRLIVTLSFVGSYEAGMF